MFHTAVGGLGAGPTRRGTSTCRRDGPDGVQIHQGAAAARERRYRKYTAGPRKGTVMPSGPLAAPHRQRSMQGGAEYIEHRKRVKPRADEGGTPQTAVVGRPDHPDVQYPHVISGMRSMWEENKGVKR
eukprot:11117967-Heterocapsa_arctica.AAC.1